MSLIFHFTKQHCSRTLLSFCTRSTVALTRQIPCWFSIETAFASDVQKTKPIASSPLVLKKRSFTKEEEKNFGKLVYVSPTNNVIYWCKTFSLSTSIVTCLITPFILWKVTEDPVYGKFMASGWTLFSSLFIFTPFLLQKLTKRVVLEMYYNDERQLYTAIFFNILVLKRALTFSVSDVKAVNPATVMLHTHTVGKIPLLLSPQGYKDAETRNVFESIYGDPIVEGEEKDDDDLNDEPAKATTDHHKRQQDQ